MYMILHWEEGDYLTHVRNEDGSIRLFTLLEADEYANEHDPECHNLRVISIEGVNE